MSNMNMASITAKCTAYFESANGKKKVRDTLKEKVSKGEAYTVSGDGIVTPQIVDKLVRELIDTIKSTAASYDLADSVMRHFDSLQYVVEDQGDNNFACMIYFADDLSRESLESEYTINNSAGGGIQNIVALFNNGYVASNPTYGRWFGHSPYNKERARGGFGHYAWVKSTQGRPSLNFMQSAIDDFMNTHGSKYKLSITLNDIYDGNYAGSLNGNITLL